MATKTVQDSSLTSVADAIRAKTGKSASMQFPGEFVSEIGSIETGGGGISVDGLVTGAEPVGAITINASTMSPANRERVFAGCVNITSVYAPNLTMIRAMMFAYCSGLQSISFPKLTSVNGAQHFYYCESLTDVDLPRLTTLGNNSFQGCTKLETLDLPSVTRMSSVRVLYGCTKLSTLILRYTGGVVPIASDTFTGTPFASGGSGGAVYVPNALIESYKTATNWSTLYSAGTCTFVALEGSVYE